MKHVRLITYIILLCCTIAYADQFQGVSFFSPRAQGFDSARHLSHWHLYRETDQRSSNIFTVLATVAHAHSGREEHIAQALFGTPHIVVMGTAVEGRSPCDFAADYFGLSQNFKSNVRFDPSIRNELVEVEGHLSFMHMPCFYLQCYVPIVQTRWDFGLKEKLANGSMNSPFPAGYMDFDAIEPPITSFTQAFTGQVTFGQMQEPLQFGKIVGSHSKHGIADVTLTAGYHIALNDYGRADLALQVIVPTGNRPESIYFFEPLIGNGKHWQIGVDFSGDVQLWEREGTQEVRFFADVLFSTLLKSRQRRSFDFKENGFFSRFLLLKVFENNEYTGHLVPAINHTTLACKVWVDLEFDCAFMASYQHRHLFLDVGYNGWIRSKEKIQLVESITPNLGIKGVQPVADDASLNNDTQSNATIYDNTPDVPDIPSPRLLNQSDINKRSAASPRLVTHKIFGNIGYVGLTPFDSCNDGYFAAFGGEIEFQAINPRTSTRPDKTTESQWALWIKFGYSFI